MKNKYLIYAGFFTPIIFWLTLLICGLILDDYSHSSNLVSELGAIGTETQYVFTVGLVFSSFSSVLFVVGLYKTCKRTGLNVIPILIISTFSFSILGAALFPLPLGLHGILGMPSLLLPLSPLLSFVLWEKEIIPNIKQISILAFLIMSLGFLAFMPNVLSDYPGLKQRIFHVGWTFWFIYLGNRFMGLNEMLIKNK